MRWMISIIAAGAKNGVIGKDGDIPWHIPEDLRRFKRLTTGHPVIMGRKTFEAIVKRLGHPLTDRTNVVVTHQEYFSVPAGVMVYHNIMDALRDFENRDAFVIGGAEVYKQALERADMMYLTSVEKEIEGDTYFPAWNKKDWELIAEEPHEGFRFLTYRRIRP